MRNAKVVLLGIAAAFLGRADTIISAAQDSTVANWGVTNTSTYGQTVTAPSTSVLQSFTFYLGPQYSGSGAINYEADVYAWNSLTNEATGPALFTSALSSYTAGAGYTLITFFPGVAVTGGDQYVLFLTTAGLQGGQPNSTISWGSNDPATYLGGNFVYLNSGNTVEFDTAAWNVGFGGAADLAFSADFSDVPEPSAIVLLLTVIGILGAGAFRRGKRSLQTQAN